MARVHYGHSYGQERVTATVTTGLMRVATTATHDAAVRIEDGPHTPLEVVGFTHG